MSFLDRLAAKLRPLESAEDRAEARRHAELMALVGGWLAAVLAHHRQIEQAFTTALAGGDRTERQLACKRLGLLLTGHANAEEAVIYPALADAGEKGPTAMAYQEQATVKVEMALLEKLDPLSADWRDKLEYIQGAVQHHMYEEEGTWFVDLDRKLSSEQRELLSRRYLEEYERYVGRGETSSPPRLQMAAQTRPEESGLITQSRIDAGA